MRTGQQRNYSGAWMDMPVNKQITNLSHEIAQHIGTVFSMITPDRFLLTDLRVIITCSGWAIMETKLLPCKQTNDKICSLEDDNRNERWKMQKMATTIKCYHDTFADNALPLVIKSPVWQKHKLSLSGRVPFSKYSSN